MTPPPASAPNDMSPPPGQRGLRGFIYLGDPAVLPSELVGATIVVQSRNGQSWTVAAIRSSSPTPGGRRHLDFQLLPG